LAESSVAPSFCRKESSKQLRKFRVFVRFATKIDFDVSGNGALKQLPRGLEVRFVDDVY
jgi:hypothetical protein